MFKSRRLSQKIRGQSQKNVLGRIISSHFTQFLIILYCLIKIASGCNPLESVPEKKIISQTPPAKMTTIQKLYRALAYVQLRSVSEFLTFTDEEYKAMETGLIDAINQLQRRETPTPISTEIPRTNNGPISTSTEIPKTNDEVLDGILHPFGKWPDEREETKQTTRTNKKWSTPQNRRRTANN